MTAQPDHSTVPFRPTTLMASLALVFAGGLFVYRLWFADPFPSASEQRPGEDGPAGSITR